MLSLKLIHCYLTKREQRAKIIDVYSSQAEKLVDVPQDSLVFNIFLCDLFMVIPNYDGANYEDDNTPSWKNLKNVLSFSRKNF